MRGSVVPKVAASREWLNLRSRRGTGPSERHGAARHSPFLSPPTCSKSHDACLSSVYWFTRMSVMLTLYFSSTFALGTFTTTEPSLTARTKRRALISGSSHKCMHDLAPGRSASAVGRRCGCARARYAAVQSSVAQLTAACAGPALGGGPARRQPDQTQAADSMALTWRRTVKDSGTRPRLSPMFCAGAERSLTVQPPWNGQSVTIPGVWCGRTFREPATPLQIQTVFFSHVSH